MNVVIRLNGPVVPLIEKACSEVEQVLACDETMLVDDIRLGMNPNAPVSTNSTGIHFNLPKMATIDPGPNETTFLIYEETAHFIIGKRGLPHGENPLCDFLQELFAAYVERTLALKHHPKATQIGELLGVPATGTDTDVHRGIAKMLGFELAGDERATVELEQWLEGPGQGHRLRGLIELCRTHFGDATSPEEMSDLVVSAYEEGFAHGTI